MLEEEKSGDGLFVWLSAGFRERREWNERTSASARR